MDYAVGALVALAVLSVPLLVLVRKERNDSGAGVEPGRSPRSSTRTSAALVVDEVSGEPVAILARRSGVSLFEHPDTESASISRGLVAASELSAWGMNLAATVPVGTVYRMTLNEPAQKAFAAGTARVMQAADGSGQMSQIVDRSTGLVQSGRASYTPSSTVRPVAAMTLIKVASVALQQYHLHEINKALDSLRDGIERVEIKADWLIDDVLRQDHDQIVAIRSMLDQAEGQLAVVGQIDRHAVDLPSCVKEARRVLESALGRLEPLLEAADKLSEELPSAARYVRVLQASVSGDSYQVMARYQGITHTAVAAGLELLRATKLEEAMADEHFQLAYDEEIERIARDVGARLAHVIDRVGVIAGVPFDIGSGRKDYQSNQCALALSRGFRALSEHVSPAVGYLHTTAQAAADAVIDLRLRDDGQVDIAAASARSLSAFPS